MRKNKYAPDFKVYMNENVMDDSELLSSISEISHHQNFINSKPLISGTWIKSLGVNATVSYGSSRRKPVSNKTTTLLQFATELTLPVAILIEQFSNAGIPNLSPQIIISERHKIALLNYLRKEHGTLNSKKTLTRTKVRKKKVILGEYELIGPITDILYQDESPPSDTIVLLEDINDELMFLIANNPLLIYQLGHRKFEELVAKLFADRGHEVNLTKSTRDGGYDIFARVKNAFSEFIILAECKKYSPGNKVGVEIVRSLAGVVEEHKANQGIIITSSFFTKEAQQTQLRIGSRMALKDYNDLVEWIKPYSKST